MSEPVACAHCGRATGDAFDEHALCVEVAAAAELAATSRAELDSAIRRARTAGMPLRAIAKAAGLSPEWVRKIAG